MSTNITATYIITVNIDRNTVADAMGWDDAPAKIDIEDFLSDMIDWDCEWLGGEANIQAELASIEWEDESTATG